MIQYLFKFLENTYRIFFLYCSIWPTIPSDGLSWKKKNQNCSLHKNMCKTSNIVRFFRTLLVSFAKYPWRFFKEGFLPYLPLFQLEWYVNAKAGALVRPITYILTLPGTDIIEARSTFFQRTVNIINMANKTELSYNSSCEFHQNSWKYILVECRCSLKKNAS